MIHITTPLSLLFRSYLPGTGRTAITTLLCFFRRGDCVRAIPWTHQTWINVAVFRYFPIIRVYSQLNKLNKLQLYTTWMNNHFFKQQSSTICKSSLRSGHVFYPFSASEKALFGIIFFLIIKLYVSVGSSVFNS